jgi:hypothetical protein
MSFNEQLAITIIDKLIIGLFIAIVAFGASRLLETYKARQALWTEIAKERVKHIADEWNEMNKWDALVGDMFCKVAEIILGQVPHPERFRCNTLLPLTLAETAKLLSHLQRESIHDQNLFNIRWNEELVPIIEESVKQSHIVNTAIQTNRFWLGKDLYEHCRTFQMTLSNICVAFGKMNFERLEQEIPRLEEVRQDVLTTIKSIK